MIGADCTLAGRRGGPHGWCPLFYLTYSRLDRDVPADRRLGIAALLLDAGADPNEGYLRRGLPTPFTLLTGVFGHGELGPHDQPPHPHAAALARLLLDAGADPNDGQALYNRMFEPDNDHLELLFEYGLGSAATAVRGRHVLGPALDPPDEMLQGQLDWAVSHDQLARVRLLVEHGVDVGRRDGDGHTPAQRAALAGNTGDLRLFPSRAGVRRPRALKELDRLAAAIMAGDGERTRAFSADAPSRSCASAGRG